MWKRKPFFATLAGVAVAVALTGCSHHGELEITNNSDVAAKVLFDGTVVNVTAWGGVVIYDFDCTTGNVVVEPESAKPISVPGPMCPGDTMVIHDGTVDLERAPTPGSTVTNP